MSSKWYTTQSFDDDEFDESFLNELCLSVKKTRLAHQDARNAAEARLNPDQPSIKRARKDH